MYHLSSDDEHKPAMDYVITSCKHFKLDENAEMFSDEKEGCSWSHEKDPHGHTLVSVLEKLGPFQVARLAADLPWNCEPNMSDSRLRAAMLQLS